MFKITQQLLVIHGLILPIITEGCGGQPMLGSSKMLRVVGGRPAKNDAWPWLVSVQLRFTTGFTHLCGGTIISPEWIVSAAHCFSKFADRSGLWILAGSNTLLSDEKSVQYRSVKKVIEHSEFDTATNNNDVALLRLSRPLVFTDTVLPLCLFENKMDEELLSFGSCYIAGWGISDSTPFIHVVLQEAEVNLINSTICNRADWYNGLINDNMICAGFEEGLVDTCKGDSGGPLQCYSQSKERFYLYGVTSFGDGCGLPKRPGLYTRASRYIDWLRKVQETSRSPPKGLWASKILLSLLSTVVMVLM